MTNISNIKHFFDNFNNSYCLAFDPTDLTYKHMD